MMSVRGALPRVRLEHVGMQDIPSAGAAGLEPATPGFGDLGSLAQTAKAIHEWPVDEGTFARIATIATSVTAATIGRLILEPLGLYHPRGGVAAEATPVYDPPVIRSKGRDSC